MVIGQDVKAILNSEFKQGTHEYTLHCQIKQVKRSFTNTSRRNFIKNCKKNKIQNDFQKISKNGKKLSCNEHEHNEHIFISLF